MADINNSENCLDVRNIIERFEELETELGDSRDGEGNDAELAVWAKEIAANPEGVVQEAAQEFCTLQELLQEMKGYGGDHQWRGDWYPVTLIRDTYFKEYAQELAEDIGAVNESATWPNNCIDWEQATRELKMDYSTVEYDGVTYWYR